MSISHTIRLISPEVVLRTLGSRAPYSTRIDAWDISEQFERSAYLRHSNLFGSYRVAVETEIENPDEIGVAYLHGCALTRVLDRAFSYSTGRPLRSRAYEFFVQPVAPPQGWRLERGRESIPEWDWNTLTDGLSFAAAERTITELPLS